MVEPRLIFTCFVLVLRPDKEGLLVLVVVELGAEIHFYFTSPSVVIVEVQVVLLVSLIWCLDL